MAEAKPKIEARVQERLEREQAEFQQKKTNPQPQGDMGNKPRGREPELSLLRFAIAASAVQTNSGFSSRRSSLPISL